jgi:hypothetical protein
MVNNAATLHVSYAERNLASWRRNLAVCVFGSFTPPMRCRQHLIGL